MENAATIIIAILGSGGICSVLATILSARKYKAEADSMEQQIQDAHRRMELELSERLHKEYIDLSDRHKKAYEEQCEQNRLLQEQMNQLNKRFNEVMSWIMMDNASYRAYLENVIRDLKPDFIFPKTRPVPGFEEDSETGVTD